MNPEQQEFEQLRRLLVLKRHEQPPPRYFSDFSRQVIHRIQEGERAEDGVETSWFQRFWASLETKPLLAGGFGLAVCGFLAWGLAMSDAPSGAVAINDPSAPAISSLAQLPDRPAAEQPVFVGFSSTNGGVLPAAPQSSLFSDLTMPHAQSASIRIPGRN